MRMYKHDIFFDTSNKILLFSSILIKSFDFSISTILNKDVILICEFFTDGPIVDFTDRFNDLNGLFRGSTKCNMKFNTRSLKYEDIAAEEKARATYQWLIDLTDDVNLQDSLKFLREREIVAVEILKEKRDEKIFY